MECRPQFRCKDQTLKTEVIGHSPRTAGTVLPPSPTAPLQRKRAEDNPDLATRPSWPGVPSPGRTSFLLSSTATKSQDNRVPVLRVFPLLRRQEDHHQCVLHVAPGKMLRTGADEVQAILTPQPAAAQSLELSKWQQLCQGLQDE